MEQAGNNQCFEENDQRVAFLKELVCKMPKVELHVHLEGSLEPELVFSLAKRNDIKLFPHFNDEEDLRAKCKHFTCLDSFLDIYYQCTSVLCQEKDFYDLAMAYFERARRDNVVYAEMFFDPQQHKQNNGLTFEACADGILAAMRDAETKYGIRSKLIPCFLRHMSEDSAISTWLEIFKYLQSHPESKSRIVGVGLDSSEKNHPPKNFRRVFSMVRQASKSIVGDMHIVAHAGEEGPSTYIREALELLGADRIDHGVQCWTDVKLVEQLRDRRIPLTVCPLSNIRLKVFDHMMNHNLKLLLDSGLRVSIHSDDPAYFGFINANYYAIIDALNVDEHDLIKLASNAIDSTFLSEKEKNVLHQRLCDDLRHIIEMFGGQPVKTHTLSTIQGRNAQI